MFAKKLAAEIGLLVALDLGRLRVEREIHAHVFVCLEFARRQVELSQAKASAYVIANMTVEKEGYTAHAQIAVAVVGAVGRVYLRIGVKVAHALNVNHDLFVVGALECKVAERVWGVSEVKIVNETGVWIVLYVFAFDVMLQMKQWRVGAILKLQYGHLKHVYFLGWIKAFEIFNFFII